MSKARKLETGMKTYAKSELIFRSMLAQFSTAILAKATMTDPAVSQDTRDDATARYCNSVDAVMERLDQLNSRGKLSKIADFLGKTRS